MQPSSLCRAAQEHVPRDVHFPPAYWAEGRAALRVIALPGGCLPDPVSPLRRAGPAAVSQVVHVDRGQPVSGDGRGEASPGQQAV